MIVMGAFEAKVQVGVTVVDPPTLMDTEVELVVMGVVGGGYPSAPAGPERANRLIKRAPEATPIL